MKNLILILTTALCCLSFKAQAGMIFEPEVGTAISSQFQYNYGTTQYQYTQSSYPVGLRLAYRASNGFWIGVHGNYYMNGQFTSTNTNSNANDAFTRSVGSAEIGYEGARRLRIFAGYDFINNISNTPNIATTNPADFTSLNGTGAYAGIGLRFFAHMAINVFYDAPSSYSSITPTGSTQKNTFTNATYNSFTDGNVVITLSFPFYTVGR